MGQSLVERKFVKNGFNLFKPLLENGKVDLIAEKDNIYYRIQIKTVQEYEGSKFIPVRKISHNMGEYKIKIYTKSDVDFFIGVDLDLEDVYVLPINFVSKYNNSIRISKCNYYKNNFNLQELIIENDNNEDDDNVESLTDSADGNDVGTE